jgi:hypothetical protein
MKHNAQCEPRQEGNSLNNHRVMKHCSDVSLSLALLHNMYVHRRVERQKTNMEQTIGGSSNKRIEIGTKYRIIKLYNLNNDAV